MGFDDAFKAYLSKDELKFLEDVKTALERLPMSDDGTSINDSSPDCLKKIIVIAENFNLIINHLKNERTARLEFLKDHPTWSEKRRDLIAKLKEIAKAIESDKFNCNVSRLIAYLTSFTGDGLMLASAILIPITGGLSVPLGIAGGALIAAGTATSFGTSVTEHVLQKSILDEAKEIIIEDQKLFEGTGTWLEHAKKLKDTQSEVLEMDIVRDVIPDVKKIVEKGMKIRNTDKRLNYIERKANKVIERLRKSIKGKIPAIGKKTIVSLLIGFIVVTSNEEYRFVFECASLTCKSVAAAVVLLEEIAGLVTKVLTEASTKVGKASARGALALVGMIFDLVGIIKTSIDIHKGSFSSPAKKISDAANEMEKEVEVLQNAYNNLKQSRVRA